MDITSPTFNHQSSSSQANQSSFVLPPNFPFAQQELFSSCRYWPASIDSKDHDAENEKFLKQVVTPPFTTTIRIIVPLPPSPSSSSAPLVPDRRQRDENDNNDNNDDAEIQPKTLIAHPRQQLIEYTKKFQLILDQEINSRCSYDEKSMAEVIFVSPQFEANDEQVIIIPEKTSRLPLYVLVDSGCGEAVLRGGDVYAPGIISSNRSFDKGEVVDLVCAMVGSNSSGNVSVAGKMAPLVGRYVEDFSYFLENTVIVAKNCRAEMARNDCFNGRPRAGLALSTNGGIFNHPSMTVLSKVHQLVVATTTATTTSKSSLLPQPFLQNVSSMYPAAFLMKKLLDEFSVNSDRNNIQHDSNNNKSNDNVSMNKKPLRILDMCAAPGGKASHLLSRFALTFPPEFATSQNIRLVCVEKSAPRAKQLKTLLEDHHGVKTTDECVLVVTGDANKILKHGTTENDAVRSFFGDVSSNGHQPQQQDDASSSTSSLESIPLFDAILLDPPCTGFGLRPRLRTFNVEEMARVEAHADYQRKLLSTAFSLVRPGGFVSYSTCTTSKQENEMNVAWASRELKLKVLPLSDFEGISTQDQFLRVALESKPMARATMKFVASKKNNDDDDDDDNQAKIVDEVREDFQNFTKNDCCVLRFGPFSDIVSEKNSKMEASSSLPVDSVGFFVAMFQKQ